MELTRAEEPTGDQIVAPPTAPAAAVVAVLPSRRFARLPIFLWRIAVIAVLIDASLLATFYGIQLRRAAWENSIDVRFYGDVRNAFKWGTMANNVGLFNLYDTVVADGLQEPHRGLDYPPLRLTAAWAWVRWAKVKFPDVSGWENDYDLTRPMLLGNSVAEFSSAVLVFLIIRLWVRRMDSANRSPKNPYRRFRGLLPGFIGAMLMWFNPAVIWDGHCWPQWDNWLMPFYLAAVLLASLNWWFTAGIMLMIGAALKGQILIAAPVLLLWPVCALRFGCALRLVCGFAFTAAVIAVPWMKLDDRAISWCVCATLALVALTPLVWRLKISWYWSVTGTVISLLLVWPWKSEQPRNVKCWGLGITAIVALAAIFPRRLIPAVYAGAIAATLLLTMPFFNADSNWYLQGFKYGTEKFDNMITGTGMYNVARMQQVYFPEMGLDAAQSPDEQVTVPWINRQMEYRTAAAIASGICSLLCGAGAALHSRRGKPDTRFLVAMVAPWLCSVMVLTQMHGRYYVYAAAACALLAGVGPGAVGLGLIVTLVAWMGMVENQYALAGSNRLSEPASALLRELRGLDPHAGVMLIPIVLVFLYLAVMPRSRYT